MKKRKTDKEILQLQREYSEAKRQILILKDVCESVKSILISDRKLGGEDLEVNGKFVAGWRPSLYGPRFESVEWIEKNRPGMLKLMIENGIINMAPSYFSVVIKLSEE